MGMVTWIMKSWRRRLRRIDRDILFAEILKRAGNREHAIQCFLRHAETDDAWSDLNGEESETIVRGWN